MRTLLFSLLAFGLAGSLVKADPLDFKYTWHIDGVFLPQNGVQLPSIDLVFLTADDLFFGPPAFYDYHETGNTAVPLSLHESVSPNSPSYVNPFTDFSGFQVGTGDDGITDESFMGGNVAGYDTFGSPPLEPPGPEFTNSGPIYGFFNDERVLTTQTLRLDMVPEPGAASLLALGLMGIVGLALWRGRRAQSD